MCILRFFRQTFFGSLSIVHEAGQHGTTKPCGLTGVCNSIMTHLRRDPRAARGLSSQPPSRPGHGVVQPKDESQIYGNSTSSPTGAGLSFDQWLLMPRNVAEPKVFESVLVSGDYD